jgi:hypothetical protein
MPRNFAAPDPSTVVHLEAMMSEMRALRWRRGKSGREYAAKSGLSYDDVRHLSAEAWKRVRAEVLDKDAVGATVGEVLEQVMLDALSESYNPALIERGKDSKGEPHVFQESPNVARKVAIEAAKVYAMIAGAGAAERVEVTGKDGAPLNYAAMTDDQLLAILHRAGISDPRTPGAPSTGEDRGPAELPDEGEPEA